MSTFSKVSFFARKCLQMQPKRNLNLLEYQSKGLLQDFDVTVQKFRVASNAIEAENIPQEFPCKEYVIKGNIFYARRSTFYFFFVVVL